MRTLTFDHEEFPNTSTEELLRVAVASKQEFDGLTEEGESLVQLFFSLCDWHHAGELCADAASTSFPQYFYHGRIREYLNRFVPDVSVPDSDTVVTEIANRPDELEVVLETSDLLLCYHWSSSA